MQKGMALLEPSWHDTHHLQPCCFAAALWPSVGIVVYSWLYHSL